MGTCKTCGGAIFATNEVIGYGGPICRGYHAESDTRPRPTPVGTENPALATTESLDKHIDSLLSGIDKTEAEHDNGWWETSTGAEFGAEKKHNNCRQSE